MSEKTDKRPAAGKTKPVQRMEILGVPVDMVTTEEAIDLFDAMMASPECSLIVTPNSEILWNASKKDAEMREIINEAALVIPDGIGLVYASRLLGAPLSERVTGIDFLSRILVWLTENGRSIFFLGAAPASEETGGKSVAHLAAEKMQEAHQGLKVAGTRDGYFKPEDEEEIVDAINESGADFLCVAMGSPKQEKFIRKYRDRLKVRGAIGVGGSLDVWAGTLKRAPDFFRNNGLEWLYRLVQQPSRYKRMAVLPLFMFRVLADKRRKKSHVD